MITSVTLNAIREHDPCSKSWAKLLRHLGKTQADDTSVPIVEILDLLGLDDALWALCALPPEMDGAVRLLVCDLVEPAMQYTTDPRPAEALAVARKYAVGEATDAELRAACTAAWAAASDAASDAARAAAGAAASDAAWATAEAAVWAEQERIFRAWLEVTP